MNISTPTKTVTAYIVAIFDEDDNEMRTPYEFDNGIEAEKFAMWVPGNVSRMGIVARSAIYAVYTDGTTSLENEFEG
jgi:hypothetical protein